MGKTPGSTSEFHWLSRPIAYGMFSLEPARLRPGVRNGVHYLALGGSYAYTVVRADYLRYLASPPDAPNRVVFSMSQQPLHVVTVELDLTLIDRRNHRHVLRDVRVFFSNELLQEQGLSRDIDGSLGREDLGEASLKIDVRRSGLIVAWR